MSISGTKYSWASNMRPTSSMPETRPLKMASFASMPSFKASWAPSLDASSSYWFTAFLSFAISSALFSSVAMLRPPVFSDFIHHGPDIIRRHRGPDVATRPHRAHAVVHAFFYGLAHQVRRPRHQHVVGIVVPEDERLGAKLLAGFGNIVLLVDADRPGAALGHERDDVVRLSADMEHARHAQLGEDFFQIRQDQAFEHPRGKHVGRGAHLAHRDVVGASLFIFLGH